jgi:hypothetical protein
LTARVNQEGLQPVAGNPPNNKKKGNGKYVWTGPGKNRREDVHVAI